MGSHVETSQIIRTLNKAIDRIGKQRSNSAEVIKPIKNLDVAENVIQNFENPKTNDEKLSTPPQKICKSDYSKNKKVIWTTPALGRSSTTKKDGVTGSFTDDKGGTARTSGNSPHMTNSDITKNDTTKIVPNSLSVSKKALIVSM